MLRYAAIPNGRAVARLRTERQQKASEWGGELIKFFQRIAFQEKRLFFVFQPPRLRSSLPVLNGEMGACLLEIRGMTERVKDSDPGRLGRNRCVGRRPGNQQQSYEAYIYVSAKLEESY